MYLYASSFQEKHNKHLKNKTLRDQGETQYYIHKPHTVKIILFFFVTNFNEQICLQSGL